MDYVRTCFRSKWRLHTDRSILTKGRWYRAAPDAPCVNSATYLGSRSYNENELDQEYGEWGGDREYDDGVPPHILPLNAPVGGDCLGRLRDATTQPPGTASSGQGRCIHLPSGELCGNVPLKAHFSLAYATGIVTYYRNVDTYVTKDDGEGEWSGVVPTLDAVARVRVTENDDQEREWQFALCDPGPPPPPPIIYDCYCPGTGQPSVRTVELSGIVPTIAHPEVGDLNRVWTLVYEGSCRWTATAFGFTLRLWRIEEFTDTRLTVFVGTVSGPQILEYIGTTGTLACLFAYSLPFSTKNVTYMSAADATVSLVPVP